MELILKFLNENKDLLTLVFRPGPSIVILGALFSFFWWVIKIYYAHRKHEITSPFEIIEPHSDVSKAILGGDDNDPLAARNLAYQRRVSGRDICSKLIQVLDKQRYVLIVAKTGMGKTREAAQLAQKLSDEGWTNLNLKHTYWLDIPPRLPEQLQARRKLAFFLDDLNNRMTVGSAEESPRAGEPFEPMRVPLQVRLCRMLDWYEQAFTMNEIRAIATARNETVPQRRGDPSEWEKLDVDKFPKLWKRFEPYYNLPEPEDEAIVGVLESTVPRLGIDTEPADYVKIARKNDRTFANVVRNLSNVSKAGVKLTFDSYEPTLQGSWEVSYREIIDKYSAAKFVYDAVELLRSVGIELLPETVEAGAQLIAGGNFFERIRHWWSIRSALKILIREEHILKPSDGQIEGKGYLLEWEAYLLPFYAIVLRLARWHPEKMTPSLWGFAAILFYKKRYPQAEILLRQILKINPQAPPAIQNNLGVVLDGQGRYDDAISAYNQAIVLDPKDAAPHNGLGNVYLSQGRYEEAIQAYNHAIQLNPKSLHPHNGLGNVYRSQGRFEEAIQAYNHAIQLNPKSLHPHNGLGNVYRSQGRFEEAIQAYQQAIALDPKGAYPYNGLGNVYSDQDRYEEAIKAYQQAIALDPKDATPHNGLGNVYLSQGRYEEAISAYNQAILLDPQDAYFPNGLGNVYYQQGRYEEAISAYNQAILLDPQDAYFPNGLGNVYYQQGHYEEAISAYNQAILLDPKFALPHWGLGNVYRRQDRYKETIQAYQQAIVLDPQYAAPHNGLGNVYRSQGHYEEAIQAYNQSIALDPKYAYPHHGLGNVYSDQGCYEEAISEYQQAILINPKYAYPYNGLGNVYFDQGRYEEATSEYQQAIALDPKLAYPYNGLGNVYRSQGRYEKAIQAYQQAIALAPKYATPHTRLKPLVGMAGASKHLSDEAQAAKCVEQARALSPDTYNLACLESISGNIETALEYLRLALRENPAQRDRARRDPDFDFIRHDPRFQALVGED